MALKKRWQWALEVYYIAFTYEKKKNNRPERVYGFNQELDMMELDQFISRLLILRCGMQVSMIVSMTCSLMLY